MKHFKLIFNRFLKAESVEIDLNGNDNLSPVLKKAGEELEAYGKHAEKAIDKTDELGNSFEVLGSRVAKQTAVPLLNQLKDTLAKTESLLNSSQVTDKFKINASAGLDKLAVSGLMNKNPAEMTSADMNKLIATNKSFSLANLAEEQKQAKQRQELLTIQEHINAATREEKNVLTDLSSALNQIISQKEKASNIALLKQESNMETAALRSQKDVLLNAKGYSAWSLAIKDFNIVMNKALGITQKSSNELKNHSVNSDKATNSTSKFGATLKKVAGIAVRWRILYGVFRQIWDVLYGTVEKAAAYEEALNLYTVALGEYAEEATEWRDRIANALHLDPKYIMQYTGALYNLVQGLGVSEEAAYKMSTNLTQLAYDMSSYLNIDVQSAYDKIQSAMTGQSRAVASAGIAMQQASLQELAYSLGIKTLVSEMTQAEKTYLRYIQIMRSTTKMQGDLGRTIVTPENAIRVLKQQFELLGRAIGQVFIPIVMKAIPYIMALTQVLTELANKLASAFGFKLAKIDYSSLKTADTAVEDTFNNINKNAAGSSKSVKDSINRTLAAFDELNVVESESKGAGGGAGGGGNPAANIAALEPYIDGYDMLEGLTKGFDEQVAKARENLEKFLKIIKAIGIAIAVWKGIKFVNGLINFGQAIKGAYNAGKGLPGLIKLLVERFSDGYRYAKYFGEGGLTAVGSGLRNMLGPLGTFAASVAAIGGSFAVAYNETSKWNEANGSITSSVLKTTAAVGALAVAAGLLLGPMGAVAAVAAGVAGVFIGIHKNITDLKAELAKQEAYNKLFDGVGISVQILSDSLENASQKIQHYNARLEESKLELDKTDTAVETAKTSFNDLHDAIAAGIGDADTIKKLEIATDEYKTSVNNNKDAQINYHKTVTGNLKEQGRITKEEYDKINKEIREAYELKALYQSQYADDILALDKKLQAGKITQEEYNAEVQKLSDAYSGIIEPVTNVNEGFANLYAQQVKKIDLENPKKLDELMTNLNTSLDEGLISIENNKNAYLEYIDSEISATENSIMKAKDKYANNKDLTDKQREDLQKWIKEQSEALESMKTERGEQINAFEADAETLNATYKNYIATIYAQIKQAGVDADTEVGQWAERIKISLTRDMKDVDIKKSGYDLLGNYVSGILENGEKMKPHIITTFQNSGISFSEGMAIGLITGAKKGDKEYEEYLESNAAKRKIKANTYGVTEGETYTDAYIKALSSKGSYLEKATEEVGKGVNDGLAKGIKNYSSVAPTATKDMADKTIYAARDTLKTHSPSKVFEEIGINVIQGLQKGLTGQEANVIKYFTDLVAKIKAKTETASVSLKFDASADLDKSFNKILSKEQSFVNKWRNGINDLLSATKKAFNSLSLDGGNNLVYTAMKGISISKFAEGGYPTTGDLFLANENGRAEYITSLGNRTAVANQDQMVSALTNAILQGMSAIETNRQPGITQVYIGNEKIYEGQGQYQNRQAERYGTAVIKI